MNNNSSGIGFLGVLSLIFITLKLLKVLTWSWIWVLSPIWIPSSLAILVILIVLILSLIKKEK